MQVLVGKGSSAIVAGETPDSYPDALVVKLTSDLQLSWFSALSSTGVQTVDEMVVNSTAVFVLGTAWSTDPINVTTLQLGGQSGQSISAFISQVQSPARFHLQACKHVPIKRPATAACAFDAIAFWQAPSAANHCEFFGYASGCYILLIARSCKEGLLVARQHSHTISADTSPKKFAIMPHPAAPRLPKSAAACQAGMSGFLIYAYEGNVYSAAHELEWSDLEECCESLQV